MNNSNENDKKIEDLTLETKDPSLLEINVVDTVAGKDIGPGQR